MKRIVYILDTNKIGGDKVMKTISIHNSPISCMKYNTIYNAVLTTDISGMIEFNDNKIAITSLEFSPDEKCLEYIVKISILEFLDF